MLVVLALSTLTLTLGVRGQTTDAPPAPCCLPMTYEFDLYTFGGSTTNGVAKRTERQSHVKIDYPGQKLFSLSYDRDDTTGNWTMSKTFIDYNAGKTYTVGEDGVCTVSMTNDTMMKPCIPDNATFIGSGMFGYGGMSLKVNEFEFQIGTTFARAAVDTENCIPVFETVSGVDGDRSFMDTLAYSNFKPTIEDRTALHPPPGCGNGH